MAEHANGDVPVLELRDVVRSFTVRGRSMDAVAGVSFRLERGQVLGLVGESGCGKSTTMRTVLQIPPPTSGEVRFHGEVLDRGDRKQRHRVRSQMQMVFQDPISSLNPRWRVSRIIEEPLRVAGGMDRTQREARVTELLELVNLRRERFGDRRPGELSGGQAQRVAIARALAMQPDLLVFDEAVSSLDVSVQAQILNLIGTLRESVALTAVFIAHDLAVVKNVSDRVGVMYLGKLVELGGVDSLYAAPLHPYTRALLAAVPEVSLNRAAPQVAVEGDLPSPFDPPSGCRFRTRCPLATEKCAQEEPQMRELLPGHTVACHHAEVPTNVPAGQPQLTGSGDPS